MEPFLRGGRELERDVVYKGAAGDRSDDQKFDQDTFTL
jgi:hypothetical protein